MLNPHYYLMKNKKILRLESDMSFDSMSKDIKDRLLDPCLKNPMTQDQANWRVVLFRDEILDFEEYLSWLQSPEAFYDEEHEYDLTAN